MLDWMIDHLAVIMFFVLTFIMFVGYPVAFVLGAIGIMFGWLGIYFELFSANISSMSRRPSNTRTISGRSFATR